MAMVKVSVEQMSKQLSEILEDYSVDLLTEMNDGVKKVAKWGASLLKSKARSTSPGIGGNDYVNSFAYKLDKSTRFGDQYVLYCKPPYYRLAHLLEWGHRVVAPGGKVTGKRADARHHWTDAEKEISDLLEEFVYTAIQKTK